LRILLAVVDPVERLALQRLLRQWEHEVVAIHERATALEVLSNCDLACAALLDGAMPERARAALYHDLRGAPGAPYIYLILLGGPQAMAVVDAGADDFLPLPVEPGALRLRLRAAERILSLHSALVQSRQALEYKSTHDALTGLWNRGEVLARLDREIVRAQGEGPPVSVIMVDVDHFKRVNDTLGHQAGDSALREVTARLTHGIRSHDALGRYGGEEFLIVLPACAAADASRLAERLRELVRAAPLPETGCPLTISLGVASWSPDYGDAQALLRAADVALYRAKKSGRDRVEVAWEDRAIVPIAQAISAA
jgi:two-component system, cell cycle response regulator